MILSQVSSRAKGSQCSCEECDSIECFSKRYLKDLCSCELCISSKTCLYPQKLTIPVPTQVTEVDLPTPLKTEKAIVTDQDLSKTPDCFTNAEPCHFCSKIEALEKVISKSSNTAKSPKPSKIPISIDKVLCKSNAVAKAAKRLKKNISRSSSRSKTTKANPKDPNLHKELIKKEVIYVYDRNNNTKTITTKESKVSFRNIQANNSVHEQLDRNYTDEDSIENSVGAKYSDNDMEFARSTARLAAQIMNVPYTDFQSSLPETKSSILEQVSKYPIDIFNRIKEAYKACSCKVCECIAGKSMTTGDICNCKPCDCYQCKHLTVNVLESHLFRDIVDNDGCACIRCDRKNCKGITGNTAQPRICDYESESEINFDKGCDCEPCQCIECTMRRGRQKDIVVARVVQSYVNNMCDCSPCECADCVRSYGISNEHEATTRREMSTGVNRHPRCQCEACITEACVPDGNESCWCVRHSKVMSKPFQRNTTDYDIRRANLPLCFEPKDKNRNDTLAMYASITNTYPQKMFDYKRKICTCDPCECLVCNHKDKRESRDILMDEGVTNYGEHRVQKQLYAIDEKTGEHSIKIEKVNCGCNLCDCENCQTRNTLDNPKPKSTKKMCSAGTCNCGPCECLNVENQSIEDRKLFKDFPQILNVNDLHNQPVSQQYSTLRNTIDPFLEMYEGFNYNENVSTKNASINHIPTKDREKIHFYESYPYNRNCCQNTIKPQQYVSSGADTVKLDSGLCNFTNKEETDFKDLRQSPSFNSSMSCLKDSGSLSPLSRNKRKSADSSCNSSGHDYADYLIHFPKTTVQKCIDDVIKSNFMNAECIKVNYMNNKPPPVISTGYKNTMKYKPIPNPLSLMQQNNETSRLTNDNSSLTPLSFVSNRPSLCSKTSLHRMSKVIAIETTSKKEESENKANDIKTDAQKLTVENNSTVLEQLIKSVNEKDVTKIKKNVTVNPLHDDLERVQNTLAEAREFSKQLIQLLEKYENANEKFDNVSNKNVTDYPPSSEMKLQSEKKHSRIKFKKDTDAGSTQCFESQNDIRLKESPTTTSVKYIQNKNRSKSSSKLLENSKSKSSNSIRKVEEDKSKKAAISNENTSILPEKNKNKVGPIHFTSKDVSVITEPAYIFKTTTANNDNSLKPTKSSNVKDFLNTIAEEKVSDILSDVNKANSEKKEKEQKKKRNFNYMYKRTMTMSKKINNIPRHDNAELQANVITEESKTIPQGTETKRNAVYSSKNNDVTNNVSKGNLKQTAVNKNSTSNTNLKDKTDKNQDFLVLKSFENEINKYVVNSHKLAASKDVQQTVSNDDLGYVNPTLVKLDLKEALQSIPLKPEIVTSNVETVYHHENKALINLKSEVDKLLQMPLLQPFMDKINDICNSKEKSASKYTDCSKTLSRSHIAEKEGGRDRSISFYKKPLPNNKYNSLKVHYVNVRQVSDDSVLVKWDAPENLNCVEGYEVLVDGKAVHKIQSPNKCNAFVTGLPNGDDEKILLSIRTVTNIPNIERMPATTIIYRPQLAVY